MSDAREDRRALLENEERLRLAIEATGIGTWDVNAATGERRWSKEFRTILGLPADAPADTEAFSRLMHPDDRDWVNERYRAAYENPADGKYEAELRIRRASDGEERWVLIKGQVSFDLSGKPVRGVGTLLDITDQKRTAEALAESEKRYRLAVKAFHGATYETDLVSNFAYRAPRAYEMVGVRREDAEPTRDWWFRRIHPEDAPRFHAALDALLAGDAEELDLEFRVRHEDGGWIWVWQRGLAVRDSQGGLRRTVGAILDITARKRAEAALRESQARFRHMADSAPALIWMTDEMGGVSFANMHFDHLTGRPAAEMLGLGWRSIVHPADLSSFTSAAAQAFRARQPFRTEFRILARDGETLSLRCDMVPRLDDAGVFLGYTGCAVDMTDAKVARDGQLLLINELNHRVKNTLATVQSIASQTLRNASDTGQAKDVFETRLMALSRAHDVLTRENWDGASLREIVAQAIEPYRGDRDSAFTTDGPDVRLSTALALALAMALQELVTNAVKYGSLSRPGGAVLIAWSVADSGTGRLLQLRWEERGGPAVKPPTRRGFGSRLIERSLAQDPNGRVTLSFRPPGLVCEFAASIPDALSARPKKRAI